MRRYLPLLTICLGYFMVILDATIVNVALPSVHEDLGGEVSLLQWVIDAYTVVLAGLLLSAGSLGDRIGARRAFDGGLVLFSAASATCAVAPSIAVLIAARAVQGAGAALLIPNSLALLRATYSDSSRRARAVGAWGAVAGVGAAFGPILGGVLVGLVSWRAVFTVNVPVGIIAIVLGARYLPPARNGCRRDLDLCGQMLGMVSLTVLTVGLIEGGATGWTSALTLTSLIAFVPVTMLFVSVEAKRAEPMLPLGLFRSPTFAGATAVGLLINLGFYGQLFAINLYFQQERGFSALAAGLALLPEGLFVALSSAISGRLTGRTGARTPMLVGLLLGSLGFLGLVSAGSSARYPLLIAPLIAVGFGMAFTMPAATAAIIEAAPAERAGIASGVLNSARQAGGAIGVALLGTLLASGPFAVRWQAAMGCCAGAFLLGAVLTAATVSTSRPGAR